jgi:organic radical activating enzyme
MTISKVVLMITSECNLGCGYCYSRGTIKQDKAKIRNTLIEVLKRYKDINLISVTGGEPLIEFDFLMELRSLVPRRIRFGILSSCKHLSPQRIEVLKGMNMSIRVSIDGTSAFEVKKLDSRIFDLVHDNLWLFSGISKVICKANCRTAYDDFASIAKTGISEIDLFPELYVEWNDEEIKAIVEQVDKIYNHLGTMQNAPHVNLISNSDNKLMKCDKIQILPDGDLALCNSNSNSGKNIYLSGDKIDKFDSFKQLLISKAVLDLKKNNMLNEDTKDLFCMVDSYYWEKIGGVENNKQIRLSSGIKLFLALKEIVMKYDRKSLYN